MKTYPLFKAHINSNEAIHNIKEVIASGYINEGVQVTQLTNEMSRLLDAPQIVLTNSCTSALTLALRLAGVGPGDDVVTTPMTCVATNTPIVTSNAKIVWADVHPETGMVTAQTIEAALTPKTRAVMVVAWAGTPPAGLDEIWALCRRKGVKLILDAAHAFGATFNEEHVHKCADYTCYSFQAIKHVTTGDGGALVCTNADDWKSAKSLKWFGLDRDAAKDASGNWKGQQWDVDIVNAGYKFNMNNISAAIGLSQVPYVDDILRCHRNNAQLYDELFRRSLTITSCPRAPRVGSSFWVYTMLVPRYDKVKVTRDELLKRLNAEGIMAGVVHVPNDTYTAFSEYIRPLPGVTEFSSRQFSLPCGWWLKEKDIIHIAKRTLELSV